MILGGAHPYFESAEAFRTIDGTDPEAFIAALEAFVGNRVPPERRAQILSHDLRALAAAMHDRDTLEDVLPKMPIPCILFAGELDPRHAKIKECTKSMPNAQFFSLPNPNHAQAHMRSDIIVPIVKNFLQSTRSNSEC